MKAGPNLTPVLDRGLRQSIGWAMDRILAHTLGLDALSMALATRPPSAGWRPHSDRGVPDACADDQRVRAPIAST
ncbi:MAG: hypothetical protein IT210_22865 [Armatimonadetes bacterium]|nr:hypothetical protein [Armatimonadota bacterium]